MWTRRRSISALLFGLGSTLTSVLPRFGLAAEAAPDPGPSAQPGPFAVTTALQDWTDNARARTLPVKLYLPGGLRGTAPLIVFSHGLGGNREGGKAWGEHWASHGFVGLHLQHPGSDTSLWQGLGGDRLGMLAALRFGMTATQLIARAQDVSFAITEAAQRLPQADLTRVGVAGHSFGAQTVQALMGQRFPAAPGTDLRDARVKAAMPMSPSVRGERADFQYGAVQIPVFCFTGTADALPALTPEISAASRELVFQHLPPGDKYQMVFNDADHMLFNGNFDGARVVRSDAARDALQWRWIKALSLQFWRAHVLDDATAREALAGAALERALAGLGRYARK